MSSYRQQGIDLKNKKKKAFSHKSLSSLYLYIVYVYILVEGIGVKQERVYTSTAWISWALGISALGRLRFFPQFLRSESPKESIQQPAMGRSFMFCFFSLYSRERVKSKGRKRTALTTTLSDQRLRFRFTGIPASLVAQGNGGFVPQDRL